MGFYRERILPHLVDKACGGPDMARWRRRVTEGLSGTIVEIGFGSGLNVAEYPPEVTVVEAVEPSLRARELAQPRIDASETTVQHVGLDGQRLPLDDASCDGALSTFTLCTIPDVAAALSELRRVVKPGGQFHFLEHGLSPDEPVAKWQHRVEPIQKRVGDGCHLTRDPVAMITDAGFEVMRHQCRYGKGPKPWTWMTEGVAVNPGAPAPH